MQLSTSTTTATMRSPDHIPIYTVTPETRQDTRPIKRHRSARYLAHRVRESLSTQISKLICAIFLGLLLIVGIITFILWLSLRPHRPRFHLHLFSVPALAQPSSAFDTAEITVNVTARNANLNIGVYYDSIDGAVYYKDEKIGAAPLLAYAFYQEPKNTTVVIGKFGGTTLTVNNERWSEFMADRERGTVMFRLEVSSTIRFKVSSWIFKRHRLHANCDVGVGPDGLILPLYRDKRCPVYFT